MTKSAPTQWWAQPPLCRQSVQDALMQKQMLAAVWGQCGKGFRGAKHEVSPSAPAEQREKRRAEQIGWEGQCERIGKKKLQWTLGSVFCVANSQRKYFSNGWVRACLLLRCDQAPLRLLWAFKELAEARGIHVEKQTNKQTVFIPIRCESPVGWATYHFLWELCRPSVFTVWGSTAF